MDKFVVRHHGIGADTKDGAGARARRRPRLRQTRIVDGSKVVVEELIQRLRDELDAARTPEEMTRALDVLESEFVSLEMLEKTRIGIALSRLERRVDSENIRARARQLLRVWKHRAIKAMRRRQRRVETFGRTAAE